MRNDDSSFMRPAAGEALVRKVSAQQQRTRVCHRPINSVLLHTGKVGICARARRFALPNRLFRLAPPGHAGGTREVFDGGLPYYRVCVPFNYFSSRFSSLHSQAVQRCGSGF